MLVLLLRSYSWRRELSHGPRDPDCSHNIDTWGNHDPLSIERTLRIGRRYCAEAYRESSGTTARTGEGPLSRRVACPLSGMPRHLRKALARYGVHERVLSTNAPVGGSHWRSGEVAGNLQ